MEFDNRLTEKDERLKTLEKKMNKLLAEMAAAEQEKEKDPQMDEEQIYESDSDHEDASMNKADFFLGLDSAIASSAQIELSDDIAGRIKAWILNGLTSKEEKESILSSIPRSGKLSLEAPALNDEVLADLHPKAATRDNFFKEYQNLSGTALSAVSSVLNNILHDNDVPLERELILSNLSNSVKILGHLFYSLTQARKSFIMGKYEDRIQMILKKVEPTTYLFGDNLKSIIESSKAMEKVTKDLKPKNNPSKYNNSLNLCSSSGKKEVGRGSYKNSSSGKSNTSRGNYRPKPYPAKRNYIQSQPYQSRR